MRKGLKTELNIIYFSLVLIPPCFSDWATATFLSPLDIPELLSPAEFWTYPSTPILIAIIQFLPKWLTTTA